MQVSNVLHYFIHFVLLSSQEVAQPSAKCRFAVAAGTACGLVPTELKVHTVFSTLHTYELVFFTGRKEVARLRPKCPASQGWPPTHTSADVRTN